MGWGIGILLKQPGQATIVWLIDCFQLGIWTSFSNRPAVSEVLFLFSPPRSSFVFNLEAQRPHMPRVFGWAHTCNRLCRTAPFTQCARSNQQLFLPPQAAKRIPADVVPGFESRDIDTPAASPAMGISEVINPPTKVVMFDNRGIKHCRFALGAHPAIGRA